MKNRFNEEVDVSIVASDELQPLALVNVKQILDKNLSFFVPAYQRGYRWRPNEIEVLIDDLVRFMEEEGKKAEENRCPYYCLQAVVVKNRDDGQLEVIDGQQRLTTMLILLQALYTQKESSSMQKDYRRNDIQQNEWLEKNLYTINYETRKPSSNWLYEITKAYIADTYNGNTNESDNLKDSNSDYYHFIDAFESALNIFSKWGNKKIVDFDEQLNEKTRFIWYNTSLAVSSDSNVDIFDRINATKIELNNAELIKALLLQGDHFGSETHLQDQMAIDWDRIEKRLQNPSFWGFVYSTRHPYQYQTHIEYLFDMLKKKTAGDRDYYYFTFNKYNQNYPQETSKRLEYVKSCWGEIQELMLTLEEWYSDRTCYHYIGYLLEYGKQLDSSENITIPYLKDLLTDIPKDERTAKLKDLLKHSLKDVKPERLFHGQSGNYVTQILFLLNIQTEQNRKSDTARFSFSSYKEIQKNPGWNEEHVASNSDYTPKYEDREGLAYAFFEYFTGVKKEEDFDEYKKKVIGQYPSEENAKNLCERIWDFFSIDNTDDGMKIMNSTYFYIIDYFDPKHEDTFNENVPVGKSTKREKDFIWNFALLNATTNMSYGNDIYPLKRRRIMNDEGCIYTPVCTRAMFEKAYSHKLSNLMVWGRSDAKDYWDYICKCLSEFLPNNFNLPFQY
ncbi:MAG: DUF262 domain-containing protein [Bacteroidales bacterium]|nr:DUF262 domain-containing protein [Bacteroidales bacterium]